MKLVPEVYLKRQYLISVLVLGLSLVLGTIRVFADEMEIDLGDSKAAKPAVQQVAPTATPVPQAAFQSSEPVIETQPSQGTQASPSENQIEMEQAEPTPQVIQGVLKAKDLYEAGKKHYVLKEYDVAAKYWKRTLEKKDPYTPKYIYAEASAMLGIIYQFHFIHYKWAYDYYKLALKYEKNNSTAKKHIKEVKKKLKKKDWN